MVDGEAYVVGLDGAAEDGGVEDEEGVWGGEVGDGGGVGVSTATMCPVHSHLPSHLIRNINVAHGSRNCQAELSVCDTKTTFSTQPTIFGVHLGHVEATWSTCS